MPAATKKSVKPEQVVEKVKKLYGEYQGAERALESARLAYGRAMANKANEIGQTLIEAQQGLSKRAFREGVLAKLPFSQQTAKLYMRIARLWEFVLQDEEFQKAPNIVAARGACTRHKQAEDQRNGVVDNRRNNGRKGRGVREAADKAAAEHRARQGAEQQAAPQQPNPGAGAGTVLLPGAQAEGAEIILPPGSGAPAGQPESNGHSIATAVPPGAREAMAREFTVGVKVTVRVKLSPRVGALSARELHDYLAAGSWTLLLDEERLRRPGDDREAGSLTDYAIALDSLVVAPAKD
jgi:hypothetical protein